ncbi:MAG: carbohydrate ABC transporter substrate-binding protein [Ruminococcus sp.]|nr:carbohydrate ABC transporter substrate-binding protein [Ruminococcus sp.]
MKKTKAFISALLIAALSSSFCVACGGSSSSSSSNPYADVDVDSEVRDAVNQAASSSDLLPDVELENKNIKWLSHWDINPDSSGKNKPTELVVFEEKYGGTIEWVQCTWDNRYEKLAETINSGEGVDFFAAGDGDAFPKGAVRGMFTTVDEYIDFDSELWEDVKDINDTMLWQGGHYLLILQATGDNVACVYNRKTVEEAGLEDPAELYEKGEWDWNAFESMLQSFVDVDKQHYGIDGWWFEFGLMKTTGVAPISIEDGKLVSNIGDPAMERVQNYLYDLYTTNCIAIGVGDYGWTAHPEFVGEGKVLFYPVGLYEFYTDEETWKQKYGEDAFFVPMPKDPESDEYYIPVGMEAYTFVKGGQNPEGVARFMDCKRFAILDEDTKAVADQQFVDDYGWTDEMLEMKDEMQALADENPFYDLSSGVSTDCASLLDSNLRNAARGIPWNETYDSIYATVETYIQEVNDNPISSTVE